MKWPFRWQQPGPPGRDIKTDEQRQTRITTIIDRHGFNVRVYLVAASGFFTGSYNLFATNVIAPSLAYIYWNDETEPRRERDINVVTLTGSLVGMLLFGHYADRYGRKTLYGWELVIVIVATIGMAQSSEGFRTCSDPNDYKSCSTSMSIYRWITFWRFVLGVGVGAEYPMSATIGVEWSSRQSRARMLAAIFMMQPLGQLLAFVVGIAALKGISAQQKLSPDQHNFNETARVVDSVWRCVIGVGAIPATFAILARLSIPETPRYTLFIEQNDKKAHKDAVKVYGKRNSTITSGEIPSSTAAASGRASQVLVQRAKAMGIVETEVDKINPVHRAGDQGVADEQGIVDGGNSHTENMTLDHLDANRKSAGFKKEKPKKRGTEQKDRQRIQQFTWIEIHQFFIREGNWRLVAGTSLCWFILDVGFYGLGLNNPRIISKIWMDQKVNATMLPVWNSNFQNVNATIYEVLEQDAKQSIILVSIGSLLGSILFWKLVKYVPRSSWLVWSFMLLSILFAIAGGTLFRAYQSPLHVLTIALYILAQLLFNLGPNTITFMLPAEVFPTRYRGTCYGIAAAAGKLGSIVVQLVVPATDISEPESPANRFAYLLIAFAVLMPLGALFAWAWIPDVQEDRGGGFPKDNEAQRGTGQHQASVSRWALPSKSLEVLGEGKQGLERNGVQLIGLRKNVERAFGRMTRGILR